MSTFHGRWPWSRQMFATAPWLIPIRLARVRDDQCVEPSAGFSVNVTRTTCSTMPSGSHGLRPRPSATTPTPLTPRSVNDVRQARTVFALTPHRRPISSFATPSAASNRPRACRTTRCGNDGEFAIASSPARCSSLISNRAAARVPAIHEDYTNPQAISLT